MSSPLDPDARALLAAAAGAPPPWTVPLAEARARMRASYATDRRDDLRTRDLGVAGPGGRIPVRVYRADGAPRPVLVFLHGGGWVLGDLETHDLLAGALAVHGGLVVVSVDYRRAPEHPYPAALEDVLAVLDWAIDEPEEIGGDGTFAIGGDSAGGNLAAAGVLALRTRGRRLPAGQLLLYPVLDVPRRDGSYLQYGTGTSLTAEFMEWAFDAYAPPGVDRDDPLLVPGRETELAGLPPTWIVTAEFDPLRDEGLAWARALAAAGVPVHARHAEDQMHGFAARPREIPRGAALIAEVAREFGAGLHALGSATR